MKCPEETRQLLWELIYDLLSDEEAEQLRERISSDPLVARAYSETRLRADLLASAARQEGPHLPLSVPLEAGAGDGGAHDGSTQDVSADAGELSQAAPLPATGGVSRLVALLASLAALALVSITAYGYVQFGSHWASASLMVEQDQLWKEHVRVVATGPQVADPTVSNFVSINTWGLDDSLVSANVNYRVVADGIASPKQQLQTDENGYSRLELPSAPGENTVKLTVEPGGDVEIALHSIAQRGKDSQGEGAKWFVGSEIDALQPELEVLATKSRKLVVVADNDGRQVGQQTVTPPTGDALDTARSHFALLFAPEVSGPTRVTLYDTSSDPPRSLTQRFYWVPPPQEKKLSIQAVDQPDSFASGGQVQLQFQVESQGRPVSEASLRVAVVEDTVLDLFGEVAASSGSATYFALGMQPQGITVQNGSDGILVASDTAPPAPPPLVGDNSVEVQDAYRQSVSQLVERRESALHRFGAIAVLGGASLALLLMGLAILRLARGVGLMVPNLTAAVGCLLVGALWMTARIDEQGEVAFGAASAGESGQTQLSGRTVAMNRLNPRSATPPAKSLVTDAIREPSGDYSEQQDDRFGNGTGGFGGNLGGGMGSLPGRSTGTSSGHGGGGPASSEGTLGEGTSPLGGIDPASSNAPAAPAASSSTGESVTNGALAGEDTARFGQARLAEVPTVFTSSQFTTDDGGRAIVIFTLPDRPGAFQVVVEARKDDLLGRRQMKIRSQAKAQGVEPPPSEPPPSEPSPSEPSPSEPSP